MRSRCITISIAWATFAIFTLGACKEEQKRAPESVRAAAPAAAAARATAKARTLLDIPEAATSQVVLHSGADPDANDANRIYRLLRRNLALINACYQRAQRRRPALEGRLTVLIVVGAGPRGMIRKATVTERGLEDREMERCVVGSLRAFTFPRRGKAELPLRVPLIFRAPSQQRR